MLRPFAPIAWPALKLAESMPGGWLAALLARYAPTLLPVHRIALTDTTFAMLHPVPQYPDHVVITPRRYIRDLCALVEGDHVAALQALLELARQLDRERPPGGRMFTISNGSRLHVQHVHGHLVSAADAFWLVDDELIEVAHPAADDPIAILEAVREALTRVGGCQTRGSLVIADLHAAHLRIAITIAPPDDRG